MLANIIRRRSTFMKKLLIVMVLLLFVTGIIFADEYIVARPIYDGYAIVRFAFFASSGSTSDFSLVIPTPNKLEKINAKAQRLSRSQRK